MLNVRALDFSSFLNSENKNDQDEYKTIITKRLSLSLTTQNFDENCEIDHCNKSLLNDFILTCW